VAKKAKTVRKGVVLMVVLFVIMVLTALAVGFFSQRVIELSSGDNMALRAQMDFLAESGLEHARGILLNLDSFDMDGEAYWQGATAQQLTSGDDYYDINVVRDDANTTANLAYYLVTCNSYREKYGQRIGESSISAVLRAPRNYCPVAWWKLDETSGTVAADSSGNGNDGKLKNMTGNEWTTGKKNGALYFDGTNDYIKVDKSDSLDISDTFTVTLWVNYEGGSAPDNYERMLAKKKQWDSDKGWEISLETSYDEELTVRGNSDAGTAGAEEVVSSWAVGGWHHIAVVYEGSTATVYSDGVERDTVTIAPVVNNDEDLYIGRYGDSDSYHWDGKMDDIRIYGRALSASEIANMSRVLTYEEFTEAKSSSNVQSITIPTPGSGATMVTKLGSWTSGLTHSKESGSNRLLVFTAHVEDNDADMSLNSVTYGGQAMTKVVERETQEGSYRAYIVTYILNEAGIAAASGNTFSPSWSSTPDRVGYSSVFLANVNQTTPTDGSSSNGSNTASTISSSSLSTDSGDMVIVAGTAGNGGNYSVNNGFTESVEISISSADGIGGYKSADGSSETPSVTHNNPKRQVVVGFVVNKAADVEQDISEGDLLIAAVVTDGSETISAPLGEGWTLINHGAYSSKVTLGVWWKLADASESSSHQFTWNTNERCYAWMMRFTGHDPNNPINAYSSNGGRSSYPTSNAVTTMVENCFILRIGGFDDDDITIDNTGLDPSHTDITMDESDASSASCSGGAGYVFQSPIGSSGSDNFNLTNSEEYRTVTIAIAPYPGSGDGGCGISQ